MAFTESEKVAIRRYCGFPVFGNTPTTHFGYRFFTFYGQLEYRMNNLAPEEETVVRDVFLANLAILELDILKASDNLDTDKAAVWTHNRNEQTDRERLYNSWRIKLAHFFGVPYSGESSSHIGLVV